MSPRTTPSLNPDEAVALSRASRSEVETAFQRLYANIRGNSWFSINCYLVNTIDVIESDLKSNSIRESDLVDYIAASSPAHCFDGWSYLGRALGALLHGDSNTARHLGYYAELRAAMSLLASFGVGIFDRDHFVIDSAGSCAKIPGRKGTHPMTWLALEYWARSSQAKSFLERCIAPNGVLLREWFGEFPGITGFGAIAYDWIKTWGLDINRIFSDQQARNVASYRPTRLDSTSSLGANEAKSFVEDLWTHCSPLQLSRFEALDRYLLRRSLISAYQQTANPDQTDFEQRLDAMMKRLFPNLHPSMQGHWLSFLKDSSSYQDPLIIREAEQTAPYYDPRHPLQVIARATLLLRLASGSCALLMNTVPVSSPDLEFWWKPILYNFGLWNNAIEPEPTMDQVLALWDEVAGAIDDLDYSAAGSGTLTFFDLRTNSARALSVLQGCERIALWGLLP